MNAFLEELPADLRASVAQDASRRGLSEAAWLAEAAREKLNATTELTYLAERAGRGNRAAFDRVLDHVPSVAPEPGDER